MAQPVRLKPSLREKVWGKTALEPWFSNSARPIGEAWFLGDRELPLLVKLIFTSERLSVQVHPDDGEDGPRGKTEMWYILDAEPGAAIALGFREPITREQLREAARTGEIEELLNWIPVKKGETYFTPAHTVHAIGAGIVLCEIQQNSDVTYRLWDYGRPREIHIEKAVPIADLTVHPGILYSLGGPWTAGLRAAFDVNSRSYGFTPLLNLGFPQANGTTLFAELVLPVRFQQNDANQGQTAVTVGLHFGWAF